MSQRLATVRAAWNADRTKMVADTSEEARTLAYPVGDQLADDDVDAYDAFLETLSIDPDTDHGTEGGEPLLAEHRVWLDGKGNLVHERDPLAVSLLYAVNDTVDPDRVDEYLAMGEPPESRPGSGVTVVKETKMRTPAANKDARAARSQVRSTAGTGDSKTVVPGGDSPPPPPDDTRKADTVTVTN
jgi:hypothetical protein